MTTFPALANDGAKLSRRPATPTIARAAALPVALQ
jgi:hypothetical protein